MPLYYLDKDDNQQDAEVHNEILAEGDEKEALAVSAEVEEELRGKQQQRPLPYGFENGYYIDPNWRVFIVIEGIMYEIEYPGDDLRHLDPGYYDMDLEPWERP